jgi:hypothetical protein
LAGIGAGLSAIGSKDKASQQQLQAAIGATGQSYDDFGKQIDSAIKKQENYGHTAGETQDALRILTQATNDPAKALQYLGETSDLAAAKHESLTAAASTLGKAYNGSAKALKEFGITTVSTTTATKQLAADQKAVETTATASAAAHQHLADVHALLAGKTKLTTSETITLRDANQKAVDADKKHQDAVDKLTAAQQGAAAGADSHGKSLDELAGKLKGQASAQADTFMGKLDSMKAKFEDSAAQLGQKYGPALTAVGTVLSGVGAAIEVVTALHESSVFGWLADAAAAAVAAVAENLALLGIPILIAAVVAGIAWMVTHWGKVKEAVMDVYNWIKANWPLLLAIITGPFGLAALEIYRHWSDIKGWAQDAFDFIKRLWGDLESILEAPFKAALDTITRIWNDTIGKLKLPSIPGGGIISGALSHLASGGIVTSPTLALIGESGPEAVIPLSRVGSQAAGQSSTLHIEHATFNSAVDVDMLSKRLEFATNTGVHI